MMVATRTTASLAAAAARRRGRGRLGAVLCPRVPQVSGRGRPCLQTWTRTPWQATRLWARSKLLLRRHPRRQQPQRGRRACLQLPACPSRKPHPHPRRLPPLPLPAPRSCSASSTTTTTALPARCLAARPVPSQPLPLLLLLLQPRRHQRPRGLPLRLPNQLQRLPCSALARCLETMTTSHRWPSQQHQQRLLLPLPQPQQLQPLGLPLHLLLPQRRRPPPNPQPACLGASRARCLVVATTTTAAGSALERLPRGQVRYQLHCYRDCLLTSPSLQCPHQPPRLSRQLWKRPRLPLQRCP
jgi:hypothetical protein